MLFSCPNFVRHFEWELFFKQEPCYIVQGKIVIAMIGEFVIDSF